MGQSNGWVGPWVGEGTTPPFAEARRMGHPRLCFGCGSGGLVGVYGGEGGKVVGAEDSGGGLVEEVEI